LFNISKGRARNPQTSPALLNFEHVNPPLPHLLFDFGNVLIRIDPALTRHAFARLGARHTDSPEWTALFDQLDRGTLPEADFFDALKTFFPQRISKRQLREAWNSLLLDIPDTTLDLLYGLKKDFRLHLLSNTNFPHLHSIEKSAGPYRWKRFRSAFDHLWFSCEIGLRKPQPELYRWVLDQLDVAPEHCLLVDDLEANRTGAKALGLNTLDFALSEGGDHRELYDRLRSYALPHG